MEREREMEGGRERWVVGQEGWGCDRLSRTVKGDVRVGEDHQPEEGPYAEHLQISPVKT